MDLSDAGMVLHVQPELVNELDILALDVGSMRPDSVSVHLSIRSHDVKHKLSLGFGRSFPRLANAEALLFAGQLAGEAGTTAVDSSEFAVCTMALKTSRAGTTSSEISLP